MAPLDQTPLTTLKRAADRGSFDLEVIYDILDRSALCHVGFVSDAQPIVTPTIHWRVGNEVFWHGSRISRTLLESEQSRVCLTVTHMDGLVLARSAFHHSANYRSVMVYGTPQLVEDTERKIAALKALVDGLTPGRWDTLRPMTKKELAATSVLSLPLTEASAKVRSGGPNDLESDMKFPVWAGVIPVTTVVGNPQPSADNLPDVIEPENLKAFQLG